MDRADLLVVGGGVVGLAAARAFARRNPSARIVVLEKEAQFAAHASGRNSGVLHAGFYYAADSLKARYSVDGNRALVAFCEEKGVPVRRCGKLVVARTERDHAGLDELLRRGRTNGARVEDVTEEEARRIEPRVRTAGRALWSPDTAVVPPAKVMEALADDVRGLGVDLRLGLSFTGRSGRLVTTPEGPLRAGLVLNCAGAYADRVAAAWGVGRRWRLVPFKGRCLVGAPSAPPLACCVYPVPDLAMPFLGVHLTVTPEGATKIGPTATPARWREDYDGLGGLRWDELREQLRAQLRLAVRERAFRRHALRELAKQSRTLLVREAGRLASGIRRRDFRTWGRPGVRAQLVDARTGALEHDFVVEEGEASLHVLNAISPAFTCSLPFGEHLAERLEAMR